MEWILEEVILYSEITEVLTLGLISESIHSIISSKTLQREYLSSYTRFNIELLRPWIGYFDDFPDDDFEYHLYSFIRDYIRRVCYHLSGRDLLSLYIMSADIDVIIFIIDYGDIAEMSLSMLMLRLKAEEDNPLPQIMDRLFANDDHFEASCYLIHLRTIFMEQYVKESMKSIVIFLLSRVDTINLGMSINVAWV